LRVRLGIKGKQVLGVTSIVGAVAVVLTVMHLARLARVSLEESKSRAETAANTILHRAREVVGAGVDPYRALAGDPGMRSILESSLYAKNVTFAAIVDVKGIAVAHADRALEGQSLYPGGDLNALVSGPSLTQLREIYAEQGRNFELRQPLLLGTTEFGSIRIGVSTLLIRNDLNAWLQPALATSLIALLVAVFGATVLAQIMLRPIHVIRSGLTRLGRGEFGVRLDLDPHDEEFRELGAFFNTVSAQLSADRSQIANLESAVEHLEDAVAIINPKCDVLFVNPAAESILPGAAVGQTLDDLLPADHPLRRLADETLASRQSRGPVSVKWGRGPADAEHGERQILTHPVQDASGALVGVMLIVRNLEYLSQVQSTLRYSRKLAALGQLSAGVAHEVKNPLNSMMIHLELLRQQFAPHIAGRHAAARAGAAVVAAEPPAAPAAPEALSHVDVIAAEIRRLDEVVQGFLKFARPEDLKLQTVSLKQLFDEVIPIVQPEADRVGVTVVVDCSGAPEVHGDAAMLRQAFLNLALNACQAMPNGGTLTIQGESARGRRVLITFADTGVGIKPEHLKRIFELYFTTREKGSGIGLSMVYRTVQMHDGEIEVESTPGKGTTFRLFLPQA
jgi:signal transduction histidine kinase